MWRSEVRESSCFEIQEIFVTTGWDRLKINPRPELGQTESDIYLSAFSNFKSHTEKPSSFSQKAEA